MGQQQPPAAPNPAALYGQGIQTQLQFLPRMLRAEEQSRLQYDPQRILEQQFLQQLFGPTQYGQQLDALQQLDPASYAIRNQLGESVSRDLALGGQLSPEMTKQLQSQVRGAQTVRGNYLGDAATNAEALWQGQSALNLYQQRLQNAGNFLSGPTPEQQLSLIQPVSPDRSFSYVNPAAGVQGQQFGLQNYQNLLAQYQLSGGGHSPWSGAAAGAGSGALAGSSFGPYGAVIGGVAGGALGYFSTEKLKTDIKKIGEKDGLDIVEFRYKGSHARYRGVLAEQVKQIVPDAIGKRVGWLTVDYTKLGIPFEKQCRSCNQFKEIANFQKRPNCESRDGHRNICIECNNVYKRGYYGEKHRSKWQQYHHDYYLQHKGDKWTRTRLKRKFGMTLEDYNQMCSNQNGLCAICNLPPDKRGLFVDHCHDKGHVRGLLCNKCNTALGLFCDNPQFLINAVDYLTPPISVVRAS